MRKLSALLASAAVVGSLAFAGVATAATIGVNEDGTKTDTSLYAGIADVGMKQNVVSLTWASGQGIPAGQQQVIRAAITAAQAKGVKLVLTVYPAIGNASAFGNLANKDEFTAYVVNAMKSFPQIKTVIVGNEPNRENFMSPVDGGVYANILAAVYDGVKAYDSSIQVIGGALSPRGTGDGSSKFAPAFIVEMGTWVRANGNRKIMDAFSFHPYPFPVDKAPSGVSDWPTIGMADLYRLKQALWDAFNGTQQPTVEDGLKIDLDEVAYQVAAAGPAYTGAENVPLVPDDTMAQYYADLINMAACDSSIESLNFFHFIDETNLTGFQSGFLDAAKNQRSVYAKVKAAIAATGGGSSCTGTAVQWEHTTEVLGFDTDVDGKTVSLTKLGTSLTAKVRVEEDANVTIALLDSKDKVLFTTSRRVPAAAMAKPDAVATIQLPTPADVPAGSYSLKVTATSVLNPARSSTAEAGIGVGGAAAPAVKGGAKATGIVITGERATVSGKPGIQIDGTATGAKAGTTLDVYVKFPGQTTYAKGAVSAVTTAKGAFTWTRKTGKKTYVYVTTTDGAVKSNTVIIPAN